MLGGLGAAAADLGRVDAGVWGGAAERVPGVELRADDQHRDFGLDGILRQHMGDGGDGAFVAQGAGFRRVLGQRRKTVHEVGVDRPIAWERGGSGMLGMRGMMAERSSGAGEGRRDGS